jgi:hypothetical protein
MDTFKIEILVDINFVFYNLLFRSCKTLNWFRIKFTICKKKCICCLEQTAYLNCSVFNEGQSQSEGVLNARYSFWTEFNSTCKHNYCCDLLFWNPHLFHSCAELFMELHCSVEHNFGILLLILSFSVFHRIVAVWFFTSTFHCCRLQRHII